MAFPSQAPFRIDQVMAAPSLMLGLWLLLPLLASVLTWAGRTGRQRSWWIGASLFLLVVAVFFTLASWGTSDVTKLNHLFAAVPQRLPPAEPLWPLLTPLVLALPYRMAALQGLLAAAYGAVPLLLAHRWGLASWAGWWALLILFSPLLRSFLQNGITRQGLAVLLLVPLWLASSGLLPPRRGLIGASTLLSALSHTTFPISLLAALLPAALRGDWTGRWPRWRAPWRLAGAGRGIGWVRLVFGVVALALLAQALRLVLPMALLKFQLYSQKETFFSSYPIHSDVLRLELALSLAVGLVALRRRLRTLALVADPLVRQMLAYMLLLGLIQLSVRTGRLAPISFRLADLVGVFLLLSFLAWIQRQQAAWAVLPPLAITLIGWLKHRLLDAGALRCGLDDSFLCIPDRWPWLIHYG